MLWALCISCCACNYRILLCCKDFAYAWNLVWSDSSTGLCKSMHETYIYIYMNAPTLKKACMRIQFKMKVNRMCGIKECRIWACWIVFKLNIGCNVLIRTFRIHSYTFESVCVQHRQMRKHWAVVVFEHARCCSICCCLLELIWIKTVCLIELIYVYKLVRCCSCCPYT